MAKCAVDEELDASTCLRYYLRLSFAESDEYGVNSVPCRLSQEHCALRRKHRVHIRPTAGPVQRQCRLQRLDVLADRRQGVRRQAYANARHVFTGFGYLALDLLLSTLVPRLDSWLFLLVSKHAQPRCCSRCVVVLRTQLFAENKEKLILAALDTLLSYNPDGRRPATSDTYAANACHSRNPGHEIAENVNCCANAI
jgi:hypothetical protein